MLALMPPGTAFEDVLNQLFRRAARGNASEKACAHIRMNITMAVMRVVA